MERMIDYLKNNNGKEEIWYCPNCSSNRFIAKVSVLICSHGEVIEVAPELDVDSVFCAECRAEANLKEDLKND